MKRDSLGMFSSEFDPKQKKENNHQGEYCTDCFDKLGLEEELPKTDWIFQVVVAAPVYF